jgi:hypothetical protein
MLWFCLVDIKYGIYALWLLRGCSNMHRIESIFKVFNKQCRNKYHNPSKYSPTRDIQSFSIKIQFLNAFLQSFRGILFTHLKIAETRYFFCVWYFLLVKCFWSSEIGKSHKASLANKEGEELWQSFQLPQKALILLILKSRLGIVWKANIYLYIVVNQTINLFSHIWRSCSFRTACMWCIFYWVHVNLISLNMYFACMSIIQQFLV